MKVKNEQSVIARLLKNTRTQKRSCSLLEVADDIEWLVAKAGSLENVSKVIGVSTEMLRQFLNVKQLSPKVQELVKARKIDSVTVIHYLKNFNENAQLLIAKEVVAGHLTSGDVRALLPLKRSVPQLGIEELISRVQKSKNIKVYVAQFRVPSMLDNIEPLEMQFQKIVGKDEIISLNVRDSVGILELTPIGLKRIREAAKENKMTLRKFVDQTVRSVEQQIG